MSAIYFLALAAIVIAAYAYGRRRGYYFRSQIGSKVHSLPGYHGWFTAIAAAAPMIILFAVWSPMAPRLIEAEALSQLPQAMQPTDDLSRATVLREISNAQSGGALAANARPEIQDAARTIDMRRLASLVKQV
jgi:phosphate transport system permease protein